MSDNRFHRVLSLIALFILMSLPKNTHPQYLSVLARGSALYTTEQPTYHTQYGFGGGAALRITPLKWMYIQGGIAGHGMNGYSGVVQYYHINTWDWQLGFIPYQKIPLQFTIGSLQHRYTITTKSIRDFGYEIIPSLNMKTHWDGWNIGVGYPIKKWLEAKLVYEKEPFFLFYSPRTANYLRLEISLSSDYFFLKRRTSVSTE